MSTGRGLLLADDTMTGERWCSAHSALVDSWLAGLWDAATEPEVKGAALVAIGGYGRAELCPGSDIDVMLVHRGRTDAARIAEQIWYPVWDQGIHLGHSVSTPSEALALATTDLDSATSLLSARHVAGDRGLAAELAAAGSAQWQRRAKRWLTDLGVGVTSRHEKAGDVAFGLEPDLKDGRGGLRDVHALWWAHAARPVLDGGDALRVAEAYGVLLAARVELQRASGRPSNVLTLQDQPTVATALGDSDPDVLMARIAAAARTIAWTSDEVWRSIRTSVRGPLGRVRSRTRPAGPDLELRADQLHILTTSSTADDPGLALRAAAVAAADGATIARPSLERLASSTAPLIDPWAEGMRRHFVDLLLTGRAAIPVIEALDQRGVWCHILPEWDGVRSLPQRNAYHRFTVDRHLLETVANAARLRGRVERPDLLVMAALLHDLGKGGTGDHVAAGIALAGPILARLGWSAEDTETIETLVRHHLLLADVATRRDLDDDATIARVANAVGTAERLELLAALTEADSLATGPAAWSAWKAELVGQLVERAGHVLGGGHLGSLLADRFPRQDQLDRLALGGRHLEADGDRLTVLWDDRPGVFSRVAGVLALHGLDVLSAAAHSTEDGRALSEFRVTHPQPRGPIRWERVLSDLELALDGRLALAARLAERAHTYRRRQALPVEVAHPVVAWDNEASADATVIDVQATDGVGVLYRITRALGDLDLDIRSARAETRGAQVLDAFYVRDGRGTKVTDPGTLAEIARAVTHSVGS